MAGGTAVLTHVTPWMPSGQAVVLGRVLEAVEASRLLLIASPRASSPPPPDEGRAVELLGPEPSFRRLPALLEFRARTLVRSGRLVSILRRTMPGRLVACSGDPFDMPSAAVAARKCGIPLFNYLFDDYREQWATTRYRLPARSAERGVVAPAAGNIVTNELLEREYESRHGCRCSVVPNPFGSEWVLGQEETRISGSASRLLFAGSVYHVNSDALSCLARALRLLGGRWTLEVRSSQGADAARAAGIDTGRLEFFGHTSGPGLLEAVRRCDILYLPLGFRPEVAGVTVTASPAKLGEYLVSGKPVLAHVPAGSYVGSYLERNSCGTAVTTLDPALLAGAVSAMTQDAGLVERRARAAVACAKRDFSPEGSRAAFLRAIGLDG